MLISSYDLPFKVRYQPELAAGADEVRLRVVMEQAASVQAAGVFHARLLPFFLLASSGALSGEAIPPQTSTIGEWDEPRVHASVIEWTLRNVRVDLKAWAVLAQMLMVDHELHPIARIEIGDPRRPDERVEIVSGKVLSNPYPRRYAGIDFEVEFEEELYKEFTVCVDFVRPLSDEEVERISGMFFDWAPALMTGAYGVAPAAPDFCVGMPEPEVVVIDARLEWVIEGFVAHTAAIEGLINVVAAVSASVVPVMRFSIE
jgi:hypothetical protein